MKRSALLFISFLFLASCAQKDPEEEAKDLDRMVLRPLQNKQKEEIISSYEEKITTVGDVK